MKKTVILAAVIISALVFAHFTLNREKKKIPPLQFIDVRNVHITDSFWMPKFRQWSKVTVNDVFDKFEGKFRENPEEWTENNSFINFDDIAKGKKATKHHAGLPWFDGLIYETVRGAADLLAQNPDSSIIKRIDGYIDRICSAQQSDPDGYINTWTDLIEPEHRWGDNGGFLRFRHDVYNAGMLVEAGVHYYQATGKTKLLEAATRLANHMVALMGPAFISMLSTDVSKSGFGNSGLHLRFSTG